MEWIGSRNHLLFWREAIKCVEKCAGLPSSPLSQGVGSGGVPAAFSRVGRVYPEADSSQLVADAIPLCQAEEASSVGQVNTGKST